MTARRNTLIALTALVAWGAALMAPVATDADEMAFIYVDRMPVAAGTQVGRLSNFDAGRGISFRKTVHEERLDGLMIVSITVELFCGARALPASTPPTIVAFKHVPIVPTSFAAATLNDVFSHAYVRDRDGRIRAYQGLHASEMERMTDEITPACRES